ncbi:2OG-Fe(II)-dependent halogenase WelO5 family protein [Streptoalloteichus hindustanus]|uniref:2OG-Fe(II) oxygenase superfamily protein n=1 Tax=Streptoalloteichus hindustanus TaxID=2017 RepID=A0A1M5CXK2_STRHI|nr:hypothetical protein [Streptoalloteichus hindustanus]SHF59426.1 2OG-Fe(II) oxygenase superfamily protein [Streptoalloteichus hindustanus]
MAKTPRARDGRLRVTGWSGDTRYFRFAERDEFDPQTVKDVLDGAVAGVIFRGVIAPPVCRELAERFWASPRRRRRSSEAPSYYIGAYHYGKPTQQYLSEADETASAVDDVLAGPDDPVRHFTQALAQVLGEQGTTLRRARHGPQQAGRVLLRSWHAHGEYALEPHEDLSQCTDPRQHDFEIQRVARHRVCAVNICLENGDGGRLVYWNIQPDRETRTRLGVRHTGAPYPVDQLDGVERQWIEVGQGDLYVFNGSHIHAVEPSTEPGQRRTTAASLLGRVDRNTVVTWT